MPLYEFECSTCGHRFEFLSRGDEAASCPSCQGRELSRLLSAFAVRVGAGAAPRSTGPAPCGSCGDPRGPGACSMN
jgi:putative FmdB family regulatory protein